MSSIIARGEWVGDKKWTTVYTPIDICVESPEEIFQRLYTTHKIYQYKSVKAPVESRRRAMQGLVIVESLNNMAIVSKLDELNLREWERSDSPSEEDIIDALYEVARYGLVNGSCCKNAAYEIIEKSEDTKYAGLIADMMEIARITLGVTDLKNLKTVLSKPGTKGLCEIRSG